MHTAPTLEVKPTSQGWYKLRDKHGACLLLADELRQIPGCDIVVGDGCLDINLPENMLRQVDWTLVPAWVRGVPADDLAAPAQPQLVATARSLYPHQVEAAEWLLRVGGGLLADDMGLGKTSAAAAAVETYAQRMAPSRVRLVVGPGNVEGVWRRELHALGFISHPDAMAAAVGMQAYERNLRGELDSRWLFVPFHLMDKWLHFTRLNRLGGACAVIVDEAHWAKNPKSQRGRATQVASTLADFRVLLTGTPMANRTNELWNVLTALDGARSWGSNFDFRLRYCGTIHDGYGYRDTGPTHVDELRKRMARRYLRRTAKSAGLVLPPFRREIHRMEPTEQELTKFQAGVAKIEPRRLQQAISDLRAGGFGKDTLQVMTELRKLTSRLKLRATAELVEECLEQGQSVVVFTWERATAEKLAQAAAAGPSYLITGKIPQVDRERSIHDFQHVTGGALFATLDSIKEGVTLTVANRVILHDLSWVPSDVLQAEARVNRIGQTQPVVATWMLMSHSFDAILVDLLTRKAAEIEKVLDIADAAQALAATSGLETAKLDARKLLESWIQHTQGTP